MNPADKRLSPRIRVEFPATVLACRRELHGQVRNMNLNGFFVALRHALPVGELVRLRLQLPGHDTAMDCLGWIRYCDAERGSGIQMFAMSKDVRDRWVACYRQARAQDPTSHTPPVLPRMALAV